MILIDKYNSKYRVVKQKGNLYLIQEYSDKYVKRKRTRVIVKGRNNINIFIKNNGLKRVEEMFEFLYER